MVEIDALPEYERDLKRLLKKYITLESDMEEVRSILKKKPDARPPFSYRIEGLGISSCVIKVKKIACMALKGKGVNSGFRLVYAWFEEKERIVFIELYYKGDNEGEDRERIIKNFK